MARLTEFLKLYLPDRNDFYRVEEDQNKNFEKIDAKLKEWDTEKEPVIEKKSGFNLEKSDSHTSGGSTTLATSEAVKKANDNADGRVSKNGDRMTGVLRAEGGIKVGKQDGLWKQVLFETNGQGEYAIEFHPTPNTERRLNIFHRNDSTMTYLYFPIFNNDVVAYQSWVNATKAGKATTLAGYGITDFIVKKLNRENINTIQTSGIYAQEQTVNAIKSLNYPEEEAGTLFVTISAYGVQQEYTTYRSNHKYVRGKEGERWQAWERVDALEKLGLRKVWSGKHSSIGTVCNLPSDWKIAYVLVNWTAEYTYTYDVAILFKDSTDVNFYPGSREFELRVVGGTQLRLNDRGKSEDAFVLAVYVMA